MKKLLFLSLALMTAGSVSAMMFAPFRAQMDSESDKDYMKAKAEYDKKVHDYISIPGSNMIKK